MSVETAAPANDNALCTPHFAFYLASTADPINSGHPMWCQPLPRNRKTGTASGSDEPDILYKDYFSAIAAFCASDQWAPVIKAVTRQAGRPVSPDAISGISVFLEKHGAFYHPARLVVRAEGRTFSVVINVAVSRNGRATLPREVQALCRINDQRPFGWVPEVYGNYSHVLPDGRELALFTGTWFDGYHEFHPTGSEKNQPRPIVLWDGAAPPTRLSDAQTAAVYQQASLILSACYDPITTEHIFPWHHAAGDFVVKLAKDGVSVRLITVRDITPVVVLPDGESMDETAILEGLLLFFIHLTFRMRLDREDGVGEVVWAPDHTVLPVMAGFFEGLDLSARLSGLSDDFSADDFPDFFRRWCIRYPVEAFRQSAEAVMETFFPDATAERELISLHFDAHLEMLRRQMKSGTSGFP